MELRIGTFLGAKDRHRFGDTQPLLGKVSIPGADIITVTGPDLDYRPNGTTRPSRTAGDAPTATPSIRRVVIKVACEEILTPDSKAGIQTARHRSRIHEKLANLA